jgi:hypothetical protein
MRRFTFKRLSILGTNEFIGTQQSIARNRKSLWLLPESSYLLLLQSRVACVTFFPALFAFQAQRAKSMSMDLVYSCASSHPSSRYWYSSRSVNPNFVDSEKSSTSSYRNSSRMCSTSFGRQPTSPLSSTNGCSRYSCCLYSHDKFSHASTEPS